MTSVLQCCLIRFNAATSPIIYRPFKSQYSNKRDEWFKRRSSNTIVVKNVAMIWAHRVDEGKKNDK